ncbi:MAG TPA: hypothetical protein VGX48_18585 [Pyrinomonadaceae bacterium]|jgi:hypothetical protein|nr:hypothetical protein [Pyrinomonadaceae bacterium]
MLKRILCLALAGLLVNVAGAGPASAASKEEKDARFAERVKAGIAKLGTGRDALVEVKLRDKTKLKGYVGKAGGEHFVVADAKTGAATAVAYSQVKQVKGQNLSTGARIAVGVALAVGLLIAIAALAVWVSGGD